MSTGVDHRPVIWSVAGNDSGGGAGLSADLRAADALGVHLCPVVAAVTAQNSLAVTRVDAMPVDLLEAQFAALAADMPPQVVKTGLLGGAAQIACVARWLDRLRERAPVALVVDPVLAASTGARFADTAVLDAYRQWLLPRATLITPNRREAAVLLGPLAPDADLPAQARALLAWGAAAVCITGGDHTDGLAGDQAGHGPSAMDWMATPQASGWLRGPRVDTPHQHGTGCSFATAAAAALARGFVTADALVLAKMATHHALARGRAAGLGAGPVLAAAGFTRQVPVPLLSWGEAPVFHEAAADSHPLGLYAITDNVPALSAALDAGIRTLQLRIKTPERPTPDWQAQLEQVIGQAVAACGRVGANLYINDHWAVARRLGAPGVHLGQEDLLALGEDGRAALLTSGLRLGVSSHSLWELARARALAPDYVACGPVWPTTTKAMPWRPQGLDNLAWWCAQAGRPVVAIGGILTAEQVTQATRAGASGVCVVRALGQAPAETVPPLMAAWRAGQAGPRWPAPELPRPSLAWPADRC
jgi:hydroxymethylpyrimidine kinase/phosphomethylpyrimidine kinase/thiamine-phosphate diphosphorylase